MLVEHKKELKNRCQNAVRFGRRNYNMGLALDNLEDLLVLLWFWKG